MYTTMIWTWILFGVTPNYEMDGRPNEPFWQNSATFPIAIETFPAENTSSDFTAKVALRSDGEHLYLFFWVNESQPESIRALFRSRDGISADDQVGVIIDPFRRGERGYGFFVNALGCQLDYIQDDLQNSEDSSWDAVWSAKTRMTESGFQVEMVIPLNQMRLPQNSGQQTWGFDFVRIRPRDQRTVLRHHAIDRNLTGTLRQMTPVSAIQATPSPNLRVVPTLTQTESNADSVQHSSEGGVSMHWGFSPNASIQAAINPDFSQVELDYAQIDYNQPFTLFLQEKRPFFVESQEEYTTPETLFYSRILYQPEAAIKFTGQKGNQTLGILAVRDDRTLWIQPGAQSSAFSTRSEAGDNFLARYRYQVGGIHSIGAFLSLRQSGDYENQVASVDAKWQASDRSFWVVQAMGTQTQGDAHFEGEKKWVGGSLVRWEHHSNSWDNQAHFRWLDPDFRADLGFIPQVGVQEWSAQSLRKWWIHRPGLQRVQVFLYDRHVVKTDSSFLENNANAEVALFLPRQTIVLAGLNHDTKATSQRDFGATQGYLYADSYLLPQLELHGRLTWGQELDLVNERLVRVLRFSPGIHANLGRHLQMAYHATWLEYRDDLGQYLQLNLPDLRIHAQLNQKCSLRFTAQLQDRRTRAAERQENWGMEGLFSYRWNPFTAFYLGAQHHYQELDGLRLTPATTAYFLKLSYAWSR